MKQVLTTIIFISTIFPQTRVNINELVKYKDKYYHENKDRPFNGMVFDNSKISNNKILEFRIKDGLKNGIYQEWFNDGSPKLRCKYMNDIENGLWTEWYKNGQKYKEGRYKDGQIDGQWLEWSPNSVIITEIHYKNGILDGTWREWFDSGQKKYEKYYKSGKRDGLWIDWGENGDMLKKTHYKDDQLISFNKISDDFEKQIIDNDKGDKQIEFLTRQLLADFKDSTSYALGADLGENLMRQQVEIDYDVFMTGLVDGMETKMVILDQAQRRLIMSSLQNKIKEKTKHTTNVNIKLAEDFLLNNKKENPDVKETPTGLQYRVIIDGNGKNPSTSDRVKVHYAGKLIDGYEFDSSIKRGEPAEFGLNQVIKGWTEGLQLMRVGSKYEFFIHPKLAYGERSRPKIPANSALIFEVELLDIINE